MEDYGERVSPLDDFGGGGAGGRAVGWEVVGWLVNAMMRRGADRRTAVAEVLRLYPEAAGSPYLEER